ncbi:MAG: penicillin-binding protein 2 [Bacteroidetes bacterium]|nr:penicillin-binding protein 2 [Bacteroidota bacterium]MDA0873474.1 penicillin-binding protein 2 [Bacteroidota bacterium]
MDESRSRLRIFIALIAVVLGILALRLGKLQIVERSDHTGKSAANAVREWRVQPPRGRFYDRNGVLMVDNEPRYSLFVTPRYFDRETIPLLARLVRLPDSLITQRFEAAAKHPFQRTILQGDVTFEELSRVLEQRHNLPGIDYEITQKRRYLTDARMTHALGYVREISDGTLQAFRDQGYVRGDPFGQGGLERQYEQSVRGVPGSDFKMINIKGQVVAEYLDGREDRPASNGLDLNLSIDADLQAYAESLFVGKRGGVIAIDPNTGEVLAMHSAPDFDLELFTHRLDPQVWDSIQTHVDKPLFNRVTQSQFMPGSTFKPLIAMLALSTGTIDENDTVFCGGGHPLGGGNFYKCLAKHGNLTVEEAVMHSCNTFFFEMMRRIDVNSLNRMATAFGFGNKPFLDIAASEVATGNVPDSVYYNRLFPRGWTQGTVMNLGVGQGEGEVTLIQLVRYLSVIANGGTLVTPHLVRSMTDPITGEETFPDVPPTTKLDLNETYLKIIREGMRRVTAEKSYWLDIPGIPSMAKTGSAQNTRSDEDDSVFIMAAPIENPQIAVAVLVENSGWGSTSAGPIGSFMIERYLKGHIEWTPLRRSILQQMLNTRSAPLTQRTNLD